MNKLGKDFLKSVAISLVLAGAIRIFLFQPFEVQGASMKPFFASGDYLIVDEISYRFRPIKRGEVVVFHHGPSYYIKRVVGLPGETVEIKEEGVWIDGKLLNEPLSLIEKTHGSLVTTLGPKDYFVLGDNRKSSSDSRVFGPLEKEDVVGRAWLRLFPVDRIDFFDKDNYRYGR